jgi:hypothetical protein
MPRATGREATVTFRCSQMQANTLKRAARLRGLTKGAFLRLLTGPALDRLAEDPTAPVEAATTLPPASAEGIAAEGLAERVAVLEGQAAAALDAARAAQARAGLVDVRGRVLEVARRMAATAGPRGVAVASLRRMLAVEAVEFDLALTALERDGLLGLAGPPPEGLSGTDADGVLRCPRRGVLAFVRVAR